MKHFIKYLIFCGASLFQPMAAHAEPAKSDKTAYDFTFESIDGRPMPLDQYRGKVLLVVNTASKCGFTSQYEGLQKLYDSYKDRGLVVIGVPSNDYEQEPGFPDEIKKFCLLNYGVNFPMTTKLSVKGDKAHPFYKWAHEALGFGSAPKWNFHKYLIDSSGRAADYFVSWTEPDSPKISKAIEKLLPKDPAVK